MRFRIQFYDRYSNPYDAMPYKDEVEFEARTIVEASRRLKKELRDWRRPGGLYHLGSDTTGTKAYLLKRDPKHDEKVAAIERRGTYVEHDKAKLIEWPFVRVAVTSSEYLDRGTIKVYPIRAMGEKHDPTIPYHALGRRYFR